MIAVAALLAGCTADLLPGESALPGEVPATILEGVPGQELGAAVAVAGDQLSHASSGTGRVNLVGVGGFDAPPDRTLRLWFDGSDARVGISEDGVRSLPEGDLLWPTPAATLVVGGDGLWLAADLDAVVASDGRRWALAAVRDLALDGERIAAVACPESVCTVWLLGDSAEAVAETGEGAAVGFHEGVLWWGEPELDQALGAGKLHAETGERWIGLPGDHLGRVFGGGYGAGSANADLVPRRLRLVPLNSGETLAIDRFSSTRGPALAGDDERLIVGVPSWLVGGEAAGAVLAVERSAVPDR